MKFWNKKIGRRFAGVLLIVAVGLASASVATWRANNRAEAKYWKQGREHLDQIIEIHSAYQALINDHNANTNHIEPGRLLDAAEKQLRSLKVAGDFAGFLLSPTPFFKLSELFRHYGTPATFDGFLNDTNPIARAMGLYCYARTDSNRYAQIYPQFTADETEIHVYRQTCAPYRMTLGEFAQRLHDTPDFLWDAAPYWDFQYLKARVLLGDATPEMFE